MFETIPFKAEHLAIIKLQSAQTYLGDWVTLEEGRGLEAYPSYTALVDGEPIGAAGVVSMWEGRAQAWAFISNTGPKNFLPAHRATVKFLEGFHVKRLEMTCDCDFPQAHRWAKMLGFHMECERMVAYSPDGRDASLYVRLN